VYFWNFTSERSAKNLAIDEAMIEVVDRQLDSTCEIMRVWELPAYCVVLGRSSKLAEVNTQECLNANVPILRRCSGGSTILAGPGCLMYSLVLSIEQRPHLHMIDQAHEFVMSRIETTCNRLEVNATRAGICDLAIEGKKFSGNALRIKQRTLLYHGTILYGMDLDRIEQFLGMPIREPEYRDHRSHQDFVRNINVSPGAFVRELRNVFDAKQDWSDCPYRSHVEIEAQRLLVNRYLMDEWNSDR
jgi:lipoate---protein ligase